MPTGRNWMVFIYINLGFVLILSSVYILLTISNVQQNWSAYRCDALLMPFAGLIMQPTLPPNQTVSEYTQQNFQYCTQNMMSSSMGEFLQPLEYNNYAASVNATNTTNSVNDARINSSNVRNSMNNLTTSLGNVFSNAQANSTQTSAYNQSVSSKMGVASSSVSSSGNTYMSALSSAPKTL
jgi:hypothetical protein